jgi:FAD:protein FMN transferase
MNSTARKNLIYSIVLLLMVLVVYFFRSQKSNIQTTETPAEQSGLVGFKGEILNEPYLVLYHPKIAGIETSVDSIFKVWNEKFSSDLPGSEIRDLNLKDTLLRPTKFQVDLLKSISKNHRETNFAWDPSSGPIDLQWNFSTSGARLRDSVNVAEILFLVGLQKIQFSDSLIRKTRSNIRLDLSDFGKALALDEVSSFLQKRGVQNYFLQLGRYTASKGVNEKGEVWKAKLTYPSDSVGIKKEGFLALQNRSMAISGDFTSFYSQDSLRKTFKIDPRTGYPVGHGLLSAVVLADDSETAAVISESLMVRGWKEGIALDSANQEINLILVYNEKGSGLKMYVSPTLRKYLSFPVK